MKQSEQIALLNEQQTIILDRQAKLTATDYIANKIAEGAATKTHYATQIAERAAWREDINAAQAEIERLQAIEIEPEPMPEEAGETEADPAPKTSTRKSSGK